MKASNASVQHVKVARDPRQSQLLRAAKEAVLKQLGLTTNDSRQIDHKIQQFLERAKVLGTECKGNPTDRELRHQFLAVATAAFLLAFDTEGRKRKLKQICVREGAAGQANTPLLLCVLLAYGYNKQGRRRASEDGIAVEYAISRGALPSDFVKFFGTRGQSLSTCYRIAKRPDRKLGRKQPTKISLTLPPKRSERWQQLSLGGITITMIKKKTPVDGILVDLIISPATVKRLRELIKEALKTTRNQVATSRPSLAKKSLSRPSGFARQGKLPNVKRQSVATATLQATPPVGRRRPLR
jgi:hypothetical protein